MPLLDRHIPNDKIKTVSGNMGITSQYTAGIAGETFLRALKDREEILGSYCNKCKKAFLPQRLFCERCLSRLTETRMAPHEGILETFTIAHLDLEETRLEPPKTVGFVQFKGFEGGLIHYILSSNEKKLKVGSRVKAVFLPSSQRKGSILDIAHFETI